MYKGFFINLARNATRREFLTRHLEEVGAASRYERFDAVDGQAVAHQYDTALDAGALGCWLSHVGVVEANRSPEAHLHIVEDDVLFARDAVRLFDLVVEGAEAAVGPWDLIFTDVWFSLEVAAFKLFSEKMAEHERANKYALVSLQGIPFACMASFFVNRHSAEKYVSLLSGKWTSRVAIDIYVRHLVAKGLLKAYVTLPFLTSISEHALRSDIRGDVERSRAINQIFRRAFFKDANRTSLLEEQKQYLDGANVKPLTAIYLNTLLFLLSDQWKHF